jgi:mono/diheme cytochrome c family protein
MFSTKRIICVVGFVIVLLLILMTAGYAYVRFSPLKIFDTTTEISFDINKTPEAIEEGRRLAVTICAGCHYDAKSNSLAGEYNSGQQVNEPDRFYAANITSDSVYGIGGWSNGQLNYFLRTGISNKGNYALDMPKYTNLSKDDMNALLSFLRSDDSLVHATHKPTITPPYSWMYKFTIRCMVTPPRINAANIILPDTNDLMVWGKYLATVKYSCYVCHSKPYVFVNWNEPDKSDFYFEGGKYFLTATGASVMAPSLCIGKNEMGDVYNEQSFERCLHHGIKANGKPLSEMPLYSLLSTHEIRAIYTYLRSLKKSPKGR